MDARSGLPAFVSCAAWRYVHGMTQLPLPPAPDRDVFSVSRLNREAKALLEGSFPLLWVEGELSNLSRPASGHLYFTLKDAQAQVRCALFRGSQRHVSVTPKDGMQVLVRARVSLYEGRGDYQLIVESLEEAGEGALRRAYEQLRNRLAQEGLFDGARKKPLPRLPKSARPPTSLWPARTMPSPNKTINTFSARTRSMTIMPTHSFPS